jgi:uncharacterized protein with WD repeat
MIKEKLNLAEKDTNLKIKNRAKYLCCSIDGHFESKQNKSGEFSFACNVDFRAQGQ